MAIDINKVVFEPHDKQHTKVTAFLDDEVKEVVYLDNVSVKHFLRNALTRGTMGF
jgi:hypothetical protein